MPVAISDNIFDIPIGVVNQESCKVYHDRVPIRRNAEVGEIMKPLELRYPGSYITLNNKLTQLQEDDIVEQVFQEGDVLTGLKMKHNIESQINRASNAHRRHIEICRIEFTAAPRR